MSGDGRSWMTVALAAVVSVAGVAPARAATIVLPRAGQVGIGLQGGYGALAKSGDLGGVFDHGPGITVRLRYRMRYERAIGLSFEGQKFGIRAPEAQYPPGPEGEGLPGRVNLRLILSGADFYQMFGTRTRTTKMVGIGAGLAQTSSRTANGETVYPGDGAYVAVSAGIERFVIRSWAFDLSTRYQVIFLPQDRNHDVQLALGVIFYAGY